MRVYHGSMPTERSDRAVLKAARGTRVSRMAWWREARFGMFVHWGLYSQLGRHEWVMNRERIPPAEYEKLADTWSPRPGAARAWVELAREAGMRYMVLTTKHHEGFCLWDTAQTDYNSVRRGPGRDLVREYVEACREAGLRVGLYYSLMDWHHPDGARCARDERSRRRFVDFTRECVRELVSNYGKIDILWYDVPWPLQNARLWESERMNAMVRRLQPRILLNDRAWVPEDFGTPEESIQAAEPGRSWEACMTFNGSWGYFPTAPDVDWHTSRQIVAMLRTVTAGGGNLLLNIGPAPDGSVPPLARERLLPVGRWLALHGEAVYGALDRTDGRLEEMHLGDWTLKGNTAYYWIGRWVGPEVAIGGLRGKLLRAGLVGGRDGLDFEQTRDRLVVRGLPADNPDPTVGWAVLRLVFDRKPRQVLEEGPVIVRPRWKSP